MNSTTRRQGDPVVLTVHKSTVIPAGRGEDISRGMSTIFPKLLRNSKKPQSFRTTLGVFKISFLDSGNEDLFLLVLSPVKDIEVWRAILNGMCRAGYETAFALFGASTGGYTATVTLTNSPAHNIGAELLA